MACFHAIYSAFVVGVETIPYFLLFHKIIALWKKNQYLIIDYWSIELRIKLLLIKPIKPYGSRLVGICLNINPMYIIFFGYWFTSFTTLSWLFLGLHYVYWFALVQKLCQVLLYIQDKLLCLSANGIWRVWFFCSCRHQIYLLLNRLLLNNGGITVNKTFLNY